MSEQETWEKVSAPAFPNGWSIYPKGSFHAVAENLTEANADAIIADHGAAAALATDRDYSNRAIKGLIRIQVRLEAKMAQAEALARLLTRAFSTLRKQDALLKLAVEAGPDGPLIDPQAFEDWLQEVAALQPPPDDAALRAWDEAQP